MKKRATKKAISMALAAAMAFAPVQAFAASSDIKGHWAESAITSWQDKGLISGYTDGTFKPDNSVTRAEFAAMVNKALGLTEKGEVPFSDVQSGSWYYDAISIAVKAGYCSGYEDGTFKPDATITRAEAAVMISLAKGLTQNTAAANGFADAANIPAWAKGYVGAVVGAGYMSGRPDGTFDATNTITRAEAVSSLDRAMGNTAVTDKDVVVTKDDTVIDGQTIEGNLIIDKAVGDGEVYVKNTTVAGNIIVQGGGDDSIYLENVTVKGKVIVEKEGVRVQFEGKTEATDVEVKAVCELKGRNFEGTVGTITIASDLGTSSAVKINVPATAVVISSKASVYVNANVDKVTVASDAKDSKLEVTSSAKVGTVVANGKVAISGSGKIEKLEANVDGITVSSSTTVTDTVVADGVEKPSTPSTGGGGGGSSSSSPSSNKASVTLKEGDNLQTILTDNKTSKNLTVDVPAGNYTVPKGGALTYEGEGDLTINCAEGASFTEAVNGVSLAAAAPIALTINAPNVTGTVSVEGKTTGISKLTFNAEKATVVASVPVATVEITNAKTLNVATGTTTIVTSSVDTVAVNVTNATEVTVSDKVATINVTKADKVTVNGEVANVNVNAETTIAGSGDITAINANAATTVTSTGNIGTVNAKADVTVDTAATNVTEVVVSGTANVEIKADVDKVTVADNAKTTITVADGATVTTVDTKESITVAGAGTITSVVATNTDDSTVTVTGAAESTVTVTTVTGSNVAVDGTLTGSTTVKNVKEIKIKTPANDLDYEYGTKELDLSGLEITVTYSDEGTEDITVADNAEVTVTGFDGNTEGTQTITISYAGKTATYEVTVARTAAQIVAEAKATLEADGNVVALKSEKGLTGSEVITLPTTIKVADKYDVAVTWKSENAAIVIENGVVKITPQEADAEGNVTATLSYTAAEAEEATEDTLVLSTKVLGIPVLTTVTVEPSEDVNVKVGNTQQFTAKTLDQHQEEIVVDSIEWKVEGSNSTTSGTTISKDGLLTVAADEQASELTVTATAKVGETVTKEGTATVTVVKLSDVTTLDSVTVKGEAATPGGDGIYNVELAADADLTSLKAEDVVATVTAGSNATVGTVTKDEGTSEEGTKVVFKFTVKAENGTTTKDYTVNVTKAAKSDVTADANEKTFTFTEGALIEGSNVAVVTVTGATSVDHNQVTVNPSGEDNGITATVTDGDTDNTFKVTFNGTPKAEAAGKDFTITVPAAAVTADGTHNAAEVSVKLNVTVNAVDEKTEATATATAVEFTKGSGSQTQTTTITLKNATVKNQDSLEGVTVAGVNGLTVGTVTGTTGGNTLNVQLTASEVSSIQAGKATVSIPVALLEATEDGKLPAEYVTAEVDVTVKDDDTTQSVTAVTLEGFTAPVKGAKPVTTVTVTSIDTDKYTAGEVAWTTVEESTPVGETFAPATAYKATILLTAKDGYKFSGITGDTGITITDSATGTVNGVISQASREGDTLTITVTFTETEAEPSTDATVKSEKYTVEGTSGSTGTIVANTEQITTATTVDAFVANLTVANKAQMKVLSSVDAADVSAENFVSKTNKDDTPEAVMAEGDVVVVLAEDGKTLTKYTVTVTKEVKQADVTTDAFTVPEGATEVTVKLNAGKFVDEVATGTVSDYFDLTNSQSVTISKVEFTSAASVSKDEVKLTLSGAVSDATLTIKTAAFTADAVVVKDNVTVTPAKAEITAVTVNNLTTPANEGTPVKTVDVLDSGKYNAKIEWKSSNNSGSTYDQDVETFTTGGYYQAKVTLTPVEGYKFATASFSNADNITVNSDTSSATTGTKAIVDTASEDSIVFTVTFENIEA